MRIDYCPKCGKAGLVYKNEYGNRVYGKKWCKRCRDWVVGINKPYIGKTGNG